MLSFCCQYEKSSLTPRRRFDARMNNPDKADGGMASHSRSYYLLPASVVYRMASSSSQRMWTATKGCGHAGKTATWRWIRPHSRSRPSDNSPTAGKDQKSCITNKVWRQKKVVSAWWIVSPSEGTALRGRELPLPCCYVRIHKTIHLTSSSVRKTPQSPWAAVSLWKQYRTPSVG